MAKLSKFVKNNLFTEVGGFILDARQAKVLYDLINQITVGGSYMMVGEISINNIADLNASEYLIKEPGSYGLSITNGFGGAHNMNLTVAFNSTQSGGSSGLQDFIQTIKVGEKEYARTIGHTQVGEVISINYSSWVDTKLPYNRFVSLQEPPLVRPYQIGDLVEGGIVYYILKEGDVGYNPSKQKGLVVSPVNQGIFAWNNEEYVLTGADKTTIGYGYSNSIDIVIAQTGTVYNYAARKCIDLVLGGYSDWYLPAMGELLKLYANKVEAGITDLPVGLWSSSEYDLSYAVLVYNALEYNTTEKNQQWQVRAIRSFSVDLSLKSEEDDEIMVSTGVDREIRGSGKKLSDIMGIFFSPDKIVKSLQISSLIDLDRFDLSSGQYSLTGGVVGSLIVTNEKDGDTLVGILQELNDGDVIRFRKITTLPNLVYGDWVTGIDGTAIINALGFSPYNSNNPLGYISGISSLMIIDALGFNPEAAGVAASLIETIKNGVSTEGDTLKKLFDLIVSGYSEVTVTTIADRNAHNVIKLPTNVFVLDDGDGKWALYKATTTGVNATYVKISDPDLLNIVMTASQIKSSYESNADTNAFTDALKAKLDAINNNSGILGYALSDQESNISVGVKIKDTIPYNCTLDSILSSLSEAATGSSFQINVKKNGTSIFTTKITIDANELDNLTAATPYALVTTPTTFSVGDRLEISIDAVGGVTTGKGAIIKFILIKT